MCDHCRSATARIENRMMGNRVQERASVFAGSRLEKPSIVGGGSCCAHWRKDCCGGGCCDCTKLISSCCDTKHDDTTTRASRAIDQTQQQQKQQLAHQRNSMYCTGKFVETPATSAMVDSTDFSGYHTNGNYSTCPLNSSRESRGPSTEIGVCPAIMRNLPCTSFREPKCFGGDCCDEESESECSI